MRWPRSPGRLEAYLARATRFLPASRRSEVAAELRDHVQARVTQLLLTGLEERRALETALRELGPPAPLGHLLADIHPQPAFGRGHVEPDASSEYVAELRGVSHSFPGAHGGAGAQRRVALRDVTLAVRRGESLTVLGEAGSGKSVLLSLLGLLERPEHGTLLFEGQETARLSDLARTRLRGDRVGYVSAQPNLIPELTLWQNVALPLAYAGVPVSDRRERAHAFLHEVGLADRATFLPAQVSTGQAQRAAIARALVGRPALLLADEPAAHLDEATAEQVRALLADVQAHGVTVVTATRLLKHIKVTGRTVTLREGWIDTWGGCTNSACRRRGLET